MTSHTSRSWRATRSLRRMGAWLKAIFALSFQSASTSTGSVAKVWGYLQNFFSEPAASKRSYLLHDVGAEWELMARTQSCTEQQLRIAAVS
mmetsp:Transcript_35100/g.88475  ORF Transcript_35100/g.88475 Transcript_35100/m.88475 type:complete len:91 (-) Transcript_35100:118-390(-)